MRLIDADELLDRVEWANTNPLIDHGETAVKLIKAMPTVEPTASTCLGCNCPKMEKLEAEPQRAYEQGVKDTLDKYDETFRIASDIRGAVGCKTVKECRELISNGEIQRVKHGRWIGLNRNRYNDDEATCSICGSTFASGYSDPSWWDYCPNCGADMRGEEK